MKTKNQLNEQEHLALINVTNSKDTTLKYSANPAV